MFSYTKDTIEKCSRVPVSKIKNQNNWDAGFKVGYPLWQRGEKERKEGNIEKAISFYDEARNNGYFAPALYKSYAMAYRKLKDLDSEIEMLEEGIARFKAAKSGNYETGLRDLRNQLDKAKAKRK